MAGFHAIGAAALGAGLDQVTATAAQSLSIGQAASAQVIVSASAAQGLTLAQSASGQVLVTGAATQSLALGQSASAQVILSAAASQSLSVGQSAAVQVLVSAQAAQSLGIGQDAVADPLVSHTAEQSLSISSVIQGAEVVRIPGGPIVAGTFSRGRWHAFIGEIEAEARRRREEDAAEKRREEEATQRLAAERAAETQQKRAAEDAALQARLTALQISAAASIDLTPLRQAAGQAAQAFAAASEALRKAQEAEEEEAAAALLIGGLERWTKESSGSRRSVEVDHAWPESNVAADIPTPERLGVTRDTGNRPQMAVAARPSRIGISATQPSRLERETAIAEWVGLRQTPVTGPLERMMSLQQLGVGAGIMEQAALAQMEADAREEEEAAAALLIGGLDRWKKDSSVAP